jgi:hypothetical protein
MGPLLFIKLKWLSKQRRHVTVVFHWMQCGGRVLPMEWLAELSSSCRHNKSTNCSTYIVPNILILMKEGFHCLQFKFFFLYFPRRLNIPLHCDGARIFNSCVSQGAELRDLLQGADSASICLSKVQEFKGIASQNCQFKVFFMIELRLSNGHYKFHQHWGKATGYRPPPPSSTRSEGG